MSPLEMNNYVDESEKVLVEFFKRGSFLLEKRYKYEAGEYSGTKFKNENPFFSTCIHDSYLLSTLFERM